MLHSICIISISVVYGRVQSVLCECSVNKTTPSTKDTTKATRHQQTADVVHLIKPAGHTGTGETHQLTTLSAPPPGSLHQTGKQIRPCKTSRLRDGGVSHMTNPQHKFHLSSITHRNAMSLQNFIQIKLKPSDAPLISPLQIKMLDYHPIQGK